MDEPPVEIVTDFSRAGPIGWTGERASGSMTRGLKDYAVRLPIALASALGILLSVSVPAPASESGRPADCRTLEDIYGDTKDLFQGSIGFWTFERTPSEQDPGISYGLGIDDVVVEWREFTLVKDITDCAGGECAVVQLDSSSLFEGSSPLRVTVIEKTPPAANDCDLDGTPDGTTDCNANGIPDLPVRVFSNTEFLGEIVYVDLTGVPGTYVGEIPVSSRYDSTGVLFVAQQGSDDPVVTARYHDEDDGTGHPCPNDVDPAAQGFVEDATTVALHVGEIQVIATILSDNGDDDGFADTSETVFMRLRIANRSTVDLTNLAGRLSTNDPKIDCILDAFAYIGDLAAGSETVTTDSFAFRVANVDRAASGLTDLDDFSAQLSLGFAADQFDGLASPQTVTIDLDLDATGGSGPTTFFEGFESGTFGAFEPHNMDATLFTLAASDGYRCQYSDPDWSQSNSYGQVTDCFVSANQAHAEAFYWLITPAPPSGFARAYSGNRSLHMGVFGPTPDFLTTPVSVLEAVRLRDPINLGTEGVPPELTYKHQVDLMDARSVSSPPGEGPGRYVVALQLADDAGNPVGSWTKLQPYLNVYDQQGVDNYFNCMFDPIDDGNTEDDFFDPTDPDRRLGPSSTCKPEFSFIYMGETFLPFAENRLGNAQGPGLGGSVGLGTWVESKFNLERFRGRRVRARFQNSDLKINATNTTWGQLFSTLNPGPGDDGIFIDDVQVTNVLTSPATVSSDGKDNSGLPGCGATCDTVSARLAADPPTNLTAPGQVVELSSVDSVADRCLDGVLQYRFWIDGDDNAAGGDPADTLLRSWTDNPRILDAPTASTRYLVDVRCSTLSTCTGSTALLVGVNCPTIGSYAFPMVTAPDTTTLVWGRSLSYDFAQGTLAGLSTGTYPTTASGQNQAPASSFTIAATPPANTGVWILFRESGTLGSGGAPGFCNAPPITWGWPSIEPASRDTFLGPGPGSLAAGGGQRR